MARFKEFEINKIQKVELQTEIISYATENKTQVEKPQAIIIGGQAGAGKTALQKETEIHLKNNLVVCNSDDWREFHPQIELIKHKHESDYANITGRDADKWNRGLASCCIQHGYNFLFETTFASAEIINEILTEIQNSQHKFETHIKLVAINPKLSLLGIHLRYETQKSESKATNNPAIPNGFGRYVPVDVHNKKFGKIPETLKAVIEAAKFTTLTLYKENLQLINNEIKWGIKPFAQDYSLNEQPAAYAQEIDKDLREIVKTYLKIGGQRLYELLQERQADPELIKNISQHVNMPIRENRSSF